MWERKIKNKFGETRDVLRPSGFTDKPVYDSLPNVKYTVEYLRKDLEEAEEKSHLVGSNVDPWELYDTYETDSLGLAIRETVYRMFDDDCVDYKLFIEADGKDTCAEIPGDIYRIAREAVQKGINKRIDSLNKEIESLVITVDAYKAFLEGIPKGTEMFQKWCRENGVYDLKE